MKKILIALMLILIANLDAQAQKATTAKPTVKKAGTSMSKKHWKHKESSLRISKYARCFRLLCM